MATRLSASAPLAPLTDEQRALILKYEPVGRAVAARAFDKCHGRCERIGLEGKGPGGLLWTLQQECLIALTMAARKFDPTRIGQDSGKPVTFAPLARMHAKWACVHLLRGGKGAPSPWTRSLDDENAPEIPADDLDPDEQIDASHLRVRLALLPPLMRQAAALWSEGKDDREVARALGIDTDHLDGLRADLAAALDDHKEHMREAHPKEIRQRAEALFAEGKNTREVHEQTGVPLGTVSMWKAALAKTPATAPTVTASPPPPAPEASRSPAAKGEFPEVRQAPRKRRAPAPKAAPEPSANLHAVSPPPLKLELSPSTPPPKVRPPRPSLPIQVLVEVAGARMVLPGRILRLIYSGATP